MGRVKEAYLSHLESCWSERENDYFDWLCGLVHVDGLDHSYRILARTMDNIEFVPLIPNDENRAEQGKNLRILYLGEVLNDLDRYDETVLLEPCSFFEMLVRLAMDMADILQDEDNFQELIPRCFWEMVSNMGLEDCSDEAFGEALTPSAIADYIKKRCKNVIYRHYKRSGKDGLFPLKHSKKDQRAVEIWYQMNAYLIENYDL